MDEVDRLVDEMLRATTPAQIRQARHKADLWMKTHPQDRRKLRMAGEQLTMMERTQQMKS